MSEQTYSSPAYIPQLKSDKKFRRWWNGLSQTKCAKAWFAVQECRKVDGLKSRG